MLGARRLSLGAGVGLGQRPDAKLAHLGDVGGAELAHGTDNPTDAIEHQLIFKTGGMLRRQGQSVHASALGSGGKRVAQQGCRFETQRLHLLAASGKLFRVTRLPLGQALFQQPQIRLRWLLLHPYHGLTHRLEALAWQIDGELAKLATGGVNEAIVSALEQLEGKTGGLGNGDVGPRTGWSSGAVSAFATPGLWSPGLWPPRACSPLVTSA